MSIVVDEGDNTKMQTNHSGDKRDLLSPDKNKDSHDLTGNCNNDISNDQDRSQDKSNEQVKIIKKKVKRNGFTLPFHGFQITSWVVILLDTYAYFFINVVTFSYHPAISAVLGAVYLAILMAVVYYAVKATKNDPTDPTIYAQRDAEKNGKNFDSSPYQFFCEVCEAYVRNDAKHCGACNRCVSQFDHHCRWLNNCIGESNYKAFFRLICLVFALTLLHNCTDAAVLFYINTGDERVINQNLTFYKQTMQVQYNVILGVSIVFNIAAILFLGHLISFHIFLQAKKLTTFEYIQIKQNKQNYKSKIFREVKKEEPKKDDAIETDNTNTVFQNNIGKDDESLKQETAKIIDDKSKTNSKNVRAPFCGWTKKKVNMQKSQQPNMDTNLNLYQLQQNQIQSSQDFQQNTERSHISVHTSPHGVMLSEIEAKQSIVSNGSGDSTNQSKQGLQNSKSNENLLNNNQSKSEVPKQQQQNQLQYSQSQQALQNDNHILSVVKFSTGDDQTHVQYPGLRQNHQQKRKGNMTQMGANRNKKQELEIIQEKVKEEDLAAMSVSNIKNMDIEESYSFSLRNYPNKNSVYGHGNNNGRTSNIRGAEYNGSNYGGTGQYVNSQNDEIISSQDMRNHSFQQSYKNANDFSDIETQVKQMREANQAKFQTDQKKRDGSNSTSHKDKMNNNFVEYQSQAPRFDYTDQSLSSVVEPINNKFSSHNNYLNNQQKSDLSRGGVENSIDVENNSRNSNNNGSFLPAISNAKTANKGSFGTNGHPQKLTNQWVANSLGGNMDREVSESIIEDDDNPSMAANIKVINDGASSKHQESESFVSLRQNQKSFI